MQTYLFSMKQNNVRLSYTLFIKTTHTK